ncbi:hypothetical protein B0H14DRAFT_1403013 [Mycena olivaceomarginata]|nr:hypothetical protein B0H14DRAFT_1403013 [Mycena olivaceomarginata]
MPVSPRIPRFIPGARAALQVRRASSAQPRARAYGRRNAPSDPGVLEWIADMNWPIAQGCWDQLARFPELTIEPIRAVLRRGDDGGWAMNILSFLLDDVPRALMERLRPEIERIAQRPTNDEIECMCFESAAECLEAMDHWAARMKILRWPEGQSLHRHRT